MKQTAVEWYIENVKLIEIEYLDDKITTTQLDVMIDNLVEQAKEMEKQQMIEMHDKGFDSVDQLNDEFTIEFAEWKDKFITEIEDWKQDGVYLKNKYTTKELLEIYKKEKGL